MDKTTSTPESNKSVNAPWAAQGESERLSDYVSQIHTSQGYIRLLATTTAITEIKFHEDSITENPNSISELAKAQMQEYIAGNLTQFDLPLAPKGTDFQRAVWQQLLTIVYGQTASYLDIATAMNNPKACRAVGAANGKNPIAIVIPCHRIIGANGSLTGYASGLTLKSFLLSLES